MCLIMKVPGFFSVAFLPRRDSTPFSLSTKICYSSGTDFRFRTTLQARWFLAGILSSLSFLFVCFLLITIIMMVVRRKLVGHDSRVPESSPVFQPGTCMAMLFQQRRICLCDSPGRSLIIRRLMQLTIQSAGLGWSKVKELGATPWLAWLDPGRFTAWSTSKSCNVMLSRTIPETSLHIHLRVSSNGW